MKTRVGKTKGAKAVEIANAIKVLKHFSDDDIAQAFKISRQTLLNNYNKLKGGK